MEELTKIKVLRKKGVRGTSDDDVTAQIINPNMS